MKEKKICKSQNGKRRSFKQKLQEKNNVSYPLNSTSFTHTHISKCTYVAHVCGKVHPFKHQALQLKFNLQLIKHKYIQFSIDLLCVVDVVVSGSEVVYDMLNIFLLRIVWCAYVCNQKECVFI